MGSVVLLCRLSLFYLMLVGGSAAEKRALSELDEITSAYSTLGMPTVISRLEQLLKQEAAAPIADRTMYLLSTAYRDAGREQLAAEMFKRLLLAYPTSPWVPFAEQALGQLALRRGNYVEARQHFGQLYHVRRPFFTSAANEGLVACDRAGFRQHAMQASLTYLGILFAALAFRGRRHFFPPPAELLYYVPVTLVLLGAATTRHDPTLLWAMTFLSIGGTLLIWLSAAAARDSNPARPAAGFLILSMLTRALSVLALIYLVLFFGGFLDLILETWRMGPESG